MSEEVLNIKKIKEDIQNFASERDWSQFHTPKNLAAALSVESSELLEIFQWFSEKDCQQLLVERNPDVITKIEEEISDILAYAIRLAGVLEINIPEALERKLKKNAEKYPADLVKGSARKYTDY